GLQRKRCVGDTDSSFASIENRYLPRRRAILGHSWVRLVGWVSVGPSLERDRRINPTRNPPSSANLNHMVGYAWINSLRSSSPVATLTHPTRSHSSVRLVGWVSVGPSLERDRRINPTRNPPSSANLNHMVGYAWINSLRSLSPMATLTHSTRLVSLVQRKHEHVARTLELIELDRMQMAAAGLHREILLGPDRIGHRRALERRAEIE